MLNKIKNLYFLIPAVIFLLVYSQSVFFGAVWGDDPFVIAPQCRDFNLMLKSFYDNSNYSGVHYLPMYYLQYFLVNKIFGAGAYPFGFHVYHLLAQSLVCIFATLVFYRITKNKLFSVMVVSFWIMHPVNLQMSTRLLVGAGVMGFALCLAFIYLNLKVLEDEPGIYKWFYVIFGNLFFLVALMITESNFFFPLLLYLISFYLKGKDIFNKKYLYLSIPVLVVLPVYLILRFIACGGSIFNPSTTDELMCWTEFGGIKDILFRAVWLSPQLIVHYFKLFFWPFGLMDSRAEWYMVSDSIFSLYSLFCQLFVLCLILSVFLAYKKVPLYSVGIAWFFILIVLCIQIFPLFTIAGVRYIYAPSLGLMLALFSLLFKCSNMKLRNSLLILSIPVFIFLIGRTVYYLPSSKDQLTQLVYCAKEAPLWNKLNYFVDVIKIADEQKQWDKVPAWINNDSFNKLFNESINFYLNIKPDLSTKFGPMQMAYNFYSFRRLLDSLIILGRTDLISPILNASLRVNNGWTGWYEAATFLYKTNNLNAAWEATKKAVSIKPKSPLSYNTQFVDIAVAANKFDEAEKLVLNFIKLSPKFSYPYLSIGILYSKFNKEDLALNYFKQALQADKQICSEYYAYDYVARFFIKRDMLNEARVAVNKIFALDPFNETAKNTLNEIKRLEVKT